MLVAFALWALIRVNTLHVQLQRGDKHATHTIIRIEIPFLPTPNTAGVIAAMATKPIQDRTGEGRWQLQLVSKVCTCAIHSYNVDAIYTCVYGSASI